MDQCPDRTETELGLSPQILLDLILTQPKPKLLDLYAKSNVRLSKFQFYSLAEVLGKAMYIPLKKKKKKKEEKPWVRANGMWEFIVELLIDNICRLKAT